VAVSRTTNKEHIYINSTSSWKTSMAMSKSCKVKIGYVEQVVFGHVEKLFLEPGIGFCIVACAEPALQIGRISVRISFAKSGFWPKAALRHGYPPTNVAAWRGDTNAPLRVVRKLFPASAGACFGAPVACGARSGTTSLRKK
jgi:hypothetical protein